MHLEAELAKPARFKEPSAAERARMAARRPSRRDSRKARKLRDPVPGLARQSDPWRSASLQRPRGRGHLRQLVTVVVLVILLGAAGYGLSRFTQHHHFGSLAPVTSAPKPGGLPSPTVAEPFLGTPAQPWADGAAGIVVPQAQTAGGYSAAQVTAAYETAKQMLVAANLDRQTLAGGAPDAFASMLTPQQRTQFTTGLGKTGLDSQGDENSTRAWVTSFAPGTRLVGNVIKVHGIMGAATSMNNGTPVLQIHADYLFVYPVERPGRPESLMRVVQRQIVDVDFGTYTDPGGALQPWWQIVGGGPAGARCDINDGFVHPQFPDSSPDKVKPKGTPINPYSLSTPAQSTKGCHATTGT